MLPFLPIMLGMQAAGMITDYLGARNQAHLMNLGASLNQAGLEYNLSQTRLESEDASLEAMKQLRQTLGTQIAVFAARGTSTSGGSAASLLNESFSNFNTDEQRRRMNLLGKESQIRGQGIISRLQNSSDISGLWQGFARRTFNQFPTSLSGWKQGWADLKEGFGLTKVGG